MRSEGGEEKRLPGLTRAGDGGEGVPLVRRPLGALSPLPLLPLERAKERGWGELYVRGVFFFWRRGWGRMCGQGCPVDFEATWPVAVRGK